MKVVFDIDGTLTNFEKFVFENKDYIINKYHLDVVNPNGYDIDQLFDLRNLYINQGYSEQEASVLSEKIVMDFWNKYYIKYIMTKFRPYVKETINKLTNDGYEVIIASSRKKTCDKDLIGFLVRVSTIMKFKLGNIKISNILLCKDDEEKLEKIAEIKPEILIDDKPEILEKAAKICNCICINSGYNKDVAEIITRVNSYEQDGVYNAVEEIRKAKGIYVKNLKLYPKLKRTEFTYKVIRAFGTPFVKAMFKPIILHKERISNKKPLIYSPNHRQTLDPYFIMMSSSDAIHWAALRRFFLAEDSIFNNSKNVFLRHLTSIMFRKMGLIPVNRGGDNTEMRDITNYCLKNGSCVGIFPEGTTNKHPEEKPLLDIKHGILYFAKDNDAIIQPVAVYWAPKGSKHRVAINYCNPFSMKELSIEEGAEKWKQEILKGLEENQKVLKK